MKEAFPSIDAAVVKAVLRASGGKVEPAFNALLGSRLFTIEKCRVCVDSAIGMSDPDAAEPPPPAQPPRPPRATSGPISTEEEQLAADERYARQLAEHYNGAAAYNGPPTSGAGRIQPRQLPRRGSTPRPEDFDEDRDRNFFDGMLEC